MLGIQKFDLVRVTNLQEFVYKKGNAGVTKAMVTIKFDNSDSSQSPSGLQDQKEFTITRQVEANKSKYYLNGKIETAEKIKNLFCSVQLNVNNPHFLVMQGTITKVINMNAPAILSLVEEASGTSLYKKKKELANKTIEKKQLKFEEIESILQEEIAPKRKQL